MKLIFLNLVLLCKVFVDARLWTQPCPPPGQRPAVQVHVLNSCFITDTNEEGMCERDVDCPTFTRIRKYSRKPLCFHEDGVPVFCCPPALRRIGEDRASGRRRNNTSGSEFNSVKSSVPRCDAGVISERKCRSYYQTRQRFSRNAWGYDQGPPYTPIGLYSSPDGYRPYFPQRPQHRPPQMSYPEFSPGFPNAAPHFPPLIHHPTFYPQFTPAPPTELPLNGTSRIESEESDFIYNPLPNFRFGPIAQVWKFGQSRWKAPGAPGPKIPIAYGSPTQKGEFPHMAALGWTNTTGLLDFKCGGFLVDICFVITAAHCLAETPNYVRIGGESLLDLRVQPTDLPVDPNPFIHPDYNPIMEYNDIGILKLSRCAPASIRPACLWPKDFIEFQSLTATGYGYTQGGFRTDSLLKVDIKVHDNEYCNTIFGRELRRPQGIVSSHLCAGHRFRDTCEGDSGGPLGAKKERRFSDVDIPYVMGITSFGIGCGGSPAAVYTRISSHLCWIESIIWPNG